MSGISGPEYRLLHPSSGNEETRRANIRDWLFSIGMERVEPEWDTGDGPADIYLPNRRIIIEAKRRGKAEPNAPAGSRMGETQLEQLARYIKSERTREQRSLDDDDNRNLPWIGMLTDSQTWHIWEFTATGPKYLTDWKGRRLDSSNIKQLQSLVNRTVGKEWAPADPTNIFRNSLESLTTLYEMKCDERDTITQRELWLRQLRMSGTNPAIGHEDVLFVLHTLLTVVAVKISKIYGNTDIRYGFASWVKDTEWLDGLEDIINRYNWKQQTGDVLRAMYMRLVGKKDRHIYGEYYTPDWLAEKLCLDVIDDEYLRGLVHGEDVGGVMDPACGSGTFLYHAVRRIVESDVIRDATIDDHTLTSMIIRVVHGIDIHPVAVAMAKANVLRALPEKPSEPLRIYQGDSLQVTRGTDEAQQRLDEPSLAFAVISRKGAEMRFPREFIALPDFDRRMYRFALAAVRRSMFPPGIDEGISEGVKPMLRKAFETLTRVCRDEGNDIWAWYVIQLVSLYKLKGKISRIIANPPWVRASTIQDAQRKNEVEGLAGGLDLWVGGKNATGFNIASLFVVQCLKLYGCDGVVSGWVLPDAAIRGGNWTKYIESMKPPVVWDLGRLPFPKHSGACVNILGVPKREPCRLVLNKGGKIPGPRESWDTVWGRTLFIPTDDANMSRSAWLNGKQAMARQGAILTPSCLVILDKYEEKDGTVYGMTARSRHGVWRGKSFSVEVPRSWIRMAWFNKGGLLPYTLGRPRAVILPIDEDGMFLPDRNDTKWWRDASDKYRTHRGSGKSTPKTLEAQLNYNGKLGNQFPIGKNVVLYNTSGSNICAARMKLKRIIDSSLYRVGTKSMSEALFLVAILNANIMQDRFKQTKKSDRHFHTYFWREVPIPRFKKDDENHVLLAELAKRAESVAAGVDKPNRNKIRKALRDDGVAGDIDMVVARIMGIKTDQEGIST